MLDINITEDWEELVEVDNNGIEYVLMENHTLDSQEMLNTINCFIRRRVNPIQTATGNVDKILKEILEKYEEEEEINIPRMCLEITIQLMKIQTKLEELGVIYA